MTNESHWDYILTKNYRKETTVVKQRDNLENHAKQITQFLKAQSIDDFEASQDYQDSSLPGLKVQLSFREREKRGRLESFRSSMRKLPKKSNSVKEKKKNSDSVKRKNSQRKGSSSPEEEKKVVDPADQRIGGLQRRDSNSEVKMENDSNLATHEERPIMTSLNASELMLVSADKGDLGTMQVLCDKPSDHSKSLCTAKDDKGETPFHKTAKGGYLKCLKFLASNVPDEVSSVDGAGMTPAAHAAKNGHVNCLKWLVEESSAYVELAVRDGQMGLLHHAAKEGMEQCLTYLLGFMAKRKITTDIIDDKGQTPLHIAAKMGHLACVQTLVEHGADVLAKDHEGLTSANVAYLQKQSICSRYLLMAESCWILASRVATLFREVNGFKKENKELKKTIDNLKSTTKFGLPNRPETVGAHTNDNQLDDCSKKESEKPPIGSRNFPDGESPKSTFTEADKQRPQIIGKKSHMINRDAEIKNVKHFKVVRQTSLSGDCHVIPVVSTNGIAEISPAEKVKAKEIAMVTHQLMSTRHMQMIQDKKSKQMGAEEKKPKAPVDDSAVEIVRRTNVNRSRDSRPKSLCDNELLFMRSATDTNFSYKGKKAVLERRASCTEISKQAENEFLADSKENFPKEKTFWEKVGARKLLSRKKSVKTKSPSRTLSDLQTVSTDKILELYAKESRGSCSRINSMIWEENEISPTMGRRSMSTTELPSNTRDTSIHASFRERRPNFQPLADFRMSERFTPSTSKTNDTGEDTLEKKKVRPVAKPRLKLLKSTSNTEISGNEPTKDSFGKDNVQRTFECNIPDSSGNYMNISGNYQINENFYDGTRREGLQGLDERRNETDESLECTDV